MDAYWSRDILSLFRLGRRDSFLKFMELLFASSGGIFEATAYARPCEVDRKTISNYLRVLEATHTAHRIKPIYLGKPSEIISAPKVYGFDTGFITTQQFRNFQTIRRKKPLSRGRRFVLLLMVEFFVDRRGFPSLFSISGQHRNPGDGVVSQGVRWSGRTHRLI